MREEQPKRSALCRWRWTKRGRQFFSRKIGWHHQLPPRVTPTLVTPLPLADRKTESILIYLSSVKWGADLQLERIVVDGRPRVALGLGRLFAFATREARSDHVHFNVRSKRTARLRPFQIVGRHNCVTRTRDRLTVVTTGATLLENNEASAKLTTANGGWLIE